MRMNKKGFTLVELMIVLAILGLLAGIGIPSYMGVLNRARVGADVARVAQVQTLVNMFIAECGGVSGLTVAVGDFPLALTDGKELTGTSIVTGGQIDLAQFIDDSGTTDDRTLDEWLGDMETKAAQDGTWYVNADGTIFIGNDEGADVLK